MQPSLLFVYLVPFLLIYGTYAAVHRRRERLAREAVHQARTAGLTEPASLHPVIDPVRCIGCGSCVNACPEGNVLGLINKKAALISPR